MDHIPARTEAALGAGLTSTPLWIYIFNDISVVAGAIAAVCGAIVGVHAVWRMWKNRKKKPRDRDDDDDAELLEVINPH